MHPAVLATSGVKPCVTIRDHCLLRFHLLALSYYGSHGSKDVVAIALRAFKYYCWC